MLKTPKPNMEEMIGSRRPKSSDIGAKIKGPRAYPKTKSDVPRVATSAPTLNSASIWPAVGAMIDDANVQQNAQKIKIKEMPIRFFIGQF